MVKGTNDMLTLFEYLRARVYEAIIAGAQEALDELESKRAFQDGQGKLSSTATPHERRAADLLGDIVPLSESTNAEPDSPPPRKRGRPRKNENRK